MLNIGDYDVMGFRMAIKGMRNAMNSWDKSDSEIRRCSGIGIPCCECPYGHAGCGLYGLYPMLFIGEADMKLAKSLIKAGSSDRKFLRMIHVQVDVLAPLYFWKEADTYKVGTTMNSCSTMHTIHKRDLTINDFSHEHLIPVAVDSLNDTIKTINTSRQYFIDMKLKEDWWQMIQLLPSSYEQMRTWDLDYETLLNIYFQRRNHKLDEWKQFCNWIRDLPYMDEFISVLDKKEESNG